ncbi:hypothetical protein EVAR_13123_1 [Eumeta japonica]|uniref:Uncharacterized protein n=1 Tax=Eumeta variegata TaxID=151549 RepID=A0A4C1U9I7_EUMVA|nr:hypothetical protein EVAR_13123_1 [Eumeta japonica]
MDGGGHRRGRAGAAPRSAFQCNSAECTGLVRLSDAGNDGPTLLSNSSTSTLNVDTMPYDKMKKKKRNLYRIAGVIFLSIRLSRLICSESIGPLKLKSCTHTNFCDPNTGM